MRTAERVMYEAYEEGDAETALQAATRLQQCASTYLKALELHGIEKRLDDLEERIEGRRVGGTNGSAHNDS